MPLRERNSLVGVSVAVLLVLCGFVILSPTDSGRRNLAPNRLSSISHYTATDSKRERVSGDGALLKESSAIGGRESSMLDLDAPGEDVQLESAGSFNHKILAVILRYNENVDWLLQSNGSREPILPTELYQAADIDPTGCLPVFPGLDVNGTSSDASSLIAWPSWAKDYVAEKCKIAKDVEPMTVFDVERQAWLDAGLPWDTKLASKGRRLHQNLSSRIDFENNKEQKLKEGASVAVSVYGVSPLPLHIIPTQGRESLAYLTAIINNYDDLPDLMLFMHGHESSWHTFQLGQRWSLQRLKALGPRKLSSGFMQLGCYKLDDAYLFTRVVDANFDHPDRFRESIAGHYMQAWTEPGGLGEIFGYPLPPSFIRTACCATFAVQKEAILQRDKEFYEKLRNWALTTAMDKYWAGIVLEFSWHMMFTGKPVYDPSPEQCRKEMYDI